MATSTTKQTGEKTPVATTKGKGGPKGSLSACTHEGHAGKVCEDAVRERAYLKWEQAGYPTGDGVNFWLEAEAELTSSE